MDVQNAVSNKVFTMAPRFPESGNVARTVGGVDSLEAAIAALEVAL